MPKYLVTRVITLECKVDAESESEAEAHALEENAFYVVDDQCSAAEIEVSD